DGFPHPARDEVTKEGDICITNVMVGNAPKAAIADMLRPQEIILQEGNMGTGSGKCPDTFTSNFSGRHGWRESCSSSAVHAYRQGEAMTLTRIRCPYCTGKNVEEQRTYTIKCGAPRTMYYCASCER